MESRYSVQGCFFKLRGRGGVVDRKVTAHKPSSAHWNRPKRESSCVYVFSCRARVIHAIHHPFSRRICLHHRALLRRSVESRFRESSIMADLLDPSRVEGMEENLLSKDQSEVLHLEILLENVERILIQFDRPIYLRFRRIWDKDRHFKLRTVKRV